MFDLYKNIEDLCREMRNVSVSQMCDDVGISRSVMSNFKNGRSTQLSTKTLQKIANYLGVPLERVEHGFIDEYGAPPSTGGVWVPVLGRVAAGVPIEAIQDIVDYEEITKEMASHGQHFALTVKGDSMQPRIWEGDVVIVRKQDNCDSGDIAVVMVDGQDATVKRIRKRADGIELVPLNPVYEVKYFTNDEINTIPIKIIGKVVELRGKL